MHSRQRKYVIQWRPISPMHVCVRNQSWFKNATAIAWKAYYSITTDYQKQLRFRLHHSSQYRLRACTAGHVQWIFCFLFWTEIIPILDRNNPYFGQKWSNFVWLVYFSLSPEVLRVLVDMGHKHNLVWFKMNWVFRLTPAPQTWQSKHTGKSAIQFWLREDPSVATMVSIHL